ncbi:MAG: type II toxin-antitoxin system RelB/DinJ family antitoxin [Isosphaeraceae bacterium]
MTKKVKAQVTAPGSAAEKGPVAAEVVQTGMIRARVSANLKVEAESILNQIGLSASDAIRMFYRQIILCNGLPFPARIPNATTRKVLRDAEAGKNLTRYADADDDMFRKLGVKSGQS